MNSIKQSTGIVGIVAVILSMSLGLTYVKASMTIPLRVAQYELDRLAPDAMAQEASFTIDSCNTITIEMVATIAGLSTTIEVPGGQQILESEIGLLGGNFSIVEGSNDFDDGPTILPILSPGVHYNYTFPCQGPGTYIAKFSAPNDLAEEAAVITTVRFDSPIAVAFFTTEPEVVQHRPLVMTAAVFDGSEAIADATISVSVLKRNTDSPFAVTLEDNGVIPDTVAGDGLYSGVIFPASLGYYGARAVITGNRNGESFIREASTAFLVIPLTSTLSGSVDDQGVDDNEDGFFDRVKFSIATDTAISGDYQAFVHLESPGGQTLVRSNVSTLAEGRGTITVDLDAEAFRKIAQEGSYAIKRVELMVVSDEGVYPADRLIDVGQTKEYTLSQFVPKESTTLFLGPQSGTILTGRTHTVTAVANEVKRRLADVDVTISVIAGPNSGLSTSGLTDALGQFSFTYAGNGGAGTDQIRARFSVDNMSNIESEIVTCEWILPPERISVPNVVNLDRAAATASIEAAGLALGDILMVSNFSFPTDVVISQVPSGENHVEKGTLVDVVVSSGPPGPLVGDLNNDGCVARDDFGILIKGLRGIGPEDASHDLNRDGVINFADLRLLFESYTHPRGAPCQ